ALVCLLGAGRGQVGGQVPGSQIGQLFGVWGDHEGPLCSLLAVGTSLHLQRPPLLTTAVSEGAHYLGPIPRLVGTLTSGGLCRLPQGADGTLQMPPRVRLLECQYIAD